MSVFSHRAVVSVSYEVKCCNTAVRDASSDNYAVYIILTGVQGLHISAFKTIGSRVLPDKAKND